MGWRLCAVFTSLLRGLHSSTRRDRLRHRYAWRFSVGRPPSKVRLRSVSLSIGNRPLPSGNKSQFDYRNTVDTCDEDWVHSCQDQTGIRSSMMLCDNFFPEHGLSPGVKESTLGSQLWLSSEDRPFHCFRPANLSGAMSPNASSIAIGQRDIILWIGLRLSPCV